MRPEIKWVVSLAVVATGMTVGVGPGRAANAEPQACEHVAQQDAQIDCYTRIIEDPGTTTASLVDARTHRSTAFDNKGEYDQAIADAAKAIEINPEYGRAYYARAFANTHKGQAELAIADYTRAIEINPRDADSLINRAILYDGKGDHDLALKELDQVLAMDGAKPLLSKMGRTFIYNNRGVAHRNRGEPDQAIADFAKAIEIDPTFAFGYYNLGLTYQSKGDLGQAITAFDKAIELNPNVAGFYYYRGLAYRGTDEFARAIADLQKTTELDANFKAAYQELARTYLAAGKAALTRVRNWITGG